jgi:hypothetical protein
MSYSEAFAILINSLAQAVGPLLGFVLGWGLFIL